MNMKKITLLLTMCLVVISVSAQFVDGQTLPLTHANFFSATAVGTAPSLETGMYTSTTQDASNPIRANQWSRSGKTSSGESGGVTPVLENSNLSFSNYIDNSVSKAIILDPTIASSTLRSTIYGLTSASEYVGTFYLSALINFSEVSGSGNDFLAFDANYTGNQQRGRLMIKASENAGFYNLGLAYGSASDISGLTGTVAVTGGWSADIALNTTHLIVMKFTFVVSGGGNEVGVLYIDPAIGGVETPETATNTVTANASMYKLRGLTVRQRPGIGGKIAGLRFSDKWADVTAAPSANGFNTITKGSNSIKAIAKTIVTDEIGNLKVYSFAGKEMLSTKTDGTFETNLNRGFYLVRFVSENGQVSSAKIEIK